MPKQTNKRRKYQEEEIMLKDITSQPAKSNGNGNGNGNSNAIKYTNGSKMDFSSLIPKDLKIVAKNESQKKLIQSIRNNEITICAGPAGSGKTFIAVSQALALLRKENSPYKKIYLVKSVTALNGEELGYLKGTVSEKFFFFMLSFYINIEKIIGEFPLNQLIEKEIIKPFPLAFVSGVTLDNCIILADECQNISMQNSRRLLTRIGSNAKLLILGDTNQIDIKNRHESSLINLLGMFENSEGIGVVTMDQNDTNVRNPIIAQIEEKYKEYDERKKTTAKSST